MTWTPPRAFGGREPVQARCEERGDRRRHVHGCQVDGRDPLALLLHQDALVEQHLQHLLDEQRVPQRRGADPLADLLGERRVAEEVLDQGVGLDLR